MRQRVNVRGVVVEQAAADLLAVAVRDVEQIAVAVA